MRGSVAQQFHFPSRGTDLRFLQSPLFRRISRRFLLLVSSSIHAFARKLEKCNGRYLVVARCIQAVALTAGRGEGERKRKSERERERDGSRHGGQFSGTCTGSPPLPSSHRFSPLPCARLPRALHFLFLLHPPRSSVFERKRETLEVARKNGESITVAPMIQF